MHRYIITSTILTLFFAFGCSSDGEEAGGTSAKLHLKIDDQRTEKNADEKKWISVVWLTLGTSAETDTGFIVDHRLTQPLENADLLFTVEKPEDASILKIADVLAASQEPVPTGVDPETAVAVGLPVIYVGDEHLDFPSTSQDCVEFDQSDCVGQTSNDKILGIGLDGQALMYVDRPLCVEGHCVITGFNLVKADEDNGAAGEAPPSTHDMADGKPADGKEVRVTLK